MRSLFAALLLAGCASVPVSDVIYVKEFPGPEGVDVVRLHSSVGECAQFGPEIKRATYTYRANVVAKPQLSNTVVEGCYFIQGGVVTMAFKDGDQGQMPLDAFAKPGEAQKPQAKRGERSA